MKDMDIKLSTGIDKNQNPWYAVEFVAGNYQSDRQFIDKIHYEYLQNFAKVDGKIDLESED